MYHKKNVDFAYLMWEDFVYQDEHKDAKKSNEMYYPRFTNVIIYYFMTKDPSIPRRNKVNWHYVRDVKMFTMIKLVSRHQNTQQFGVMLHVKLTNEDIRNSKADKEYYAVASGAAPPKTKASVRKTKSSFDTTITPPTAAGTRLLTFVKGKQPAKASKAKRLTTTPRVDVQASTTVASLTLTTPTIPPPTIPTSSQVQQAPTPPTTGPSTFLQDLPNFGSPGSKRRREGKESESTSALNKKATKTTGKSTQESKSHQKTASESTPAEEPMQTTQDLEEPSHQEFETGAADDQPIEEASQHLEWF
nr:hypothetical protein [Tanacetum cinerariifolium]